MQYRQKSKGEQRVRQAVGGVQMSDQTIANVTLVLLAFIGWCAEIQIERLQKRVKGLEEAIKRLEGDHK